MSDVLTIVGTAAGVVAAGGTIAGLRVRRSRVRITAEKRVHYAVMFVNGDIYDDVIHVTVHNKGPGSVQVKRMTFAEKGGRSGVELSAGGKPLPFVLSSEEDGEWTVPITNMLDPKYVTPGTSTRVRITVELGGRRARRSKWITVTDEDFGVSGEYHEGQDA